jgi:stage III sporulation protein AF
MWHSCRIGGDVLFLDSLRNWIVNICTAVFFITAVEMILPDNSIKKYAKFVLGIILITVFLNPIISLFNKNFNINTYGAKIMQSFSKSDSSDDIEKYRKENLNDTIKNFKINLEKNCEEKLKEEYPSENCTVKVDVKYDDKTNNININSIYVTVTSDNAGSIKKVIIDTKDNEYNSEENLNDKRSDEIKSYLSSQLDVSEDIIHVVKA